MPEHRFNTPEPVDLVVKIPVGDVEIETVDGDESVVTLEGSDRLLERTTVDLQGRKLVVEYHGKSPHGITISIGDLSWGNSKLRVRVTVPHGSSANLTNAAADMALHGRFAWLDTKTASGDLIVRGDVEGKADLKTVSGDVHLQNVGGDLDLKSVSGDLRADKVGGSVNVKSVSGDVRIESVSAGTVTVQSVSGDIEVGVAPGTNLDVDAGSVSGDLASEVPLGSEPATGGDGSTVVVRGRTVSGDFKVFRAA
jgi:Putative adhesin